MDLKVAVKTVKEFMGSYCGDHGEAMRTIVADVERRKTVHTKRAVQQLKSAIADMLDREICSDVLLAWKLTNKVFKILKQQRADI
jgi:hypothetical protein